MDVCQHHIYRRQPRRREPMEVSFMIIFLLGSFIIVLAAGTDEPIMKRTSATFSSNNNDNNNRTNNGKINNNYYNDAVLTATTSRRAQRDSIRNLAALAARRNSSSSSNSNHNNNNNHQSTKPNFTIGTASAAALVAPSQIPGRSCDFEQTCDWKWESKKGNGVGFQVTTAREIHQQKRGSPEPSEIASSGPTMDAMNGTTGHFLLLAFDKQVNDSAVYQVASPRFTQTEESCYLEANIQLHNMGDGTIKLLLTTQDHTVYEPLKQLTHRKSSWDKIRQRIGRFRQPIQVALEITPSHKIPSYVAIDDIRLLECFQDGPAATNKSCSVHEFRCASNLCISRSKVCDFFKDCPSGEDEQQDCDLMPRNTTCNFEDGWCGWQNFSDSIIRWERRNKPSGSPLTGPTNDHTYGNSSGYYLYVYMNQNKSQFNDRAILQSPLFAPPPEYHHAPSSAYYNACQLRFAYHMYGPHMGSLAVRVFERNPRQRLKGLEIWRRYGDQGNQWHRATVSIPKVHYLYYITITAARGSRYKGDIAIDDVSLSPECVGLGVPRSHLKGYVYAAQLRKHIDDSANMTAMLNRKNVTKYEFTTCNSTGRSGPNPEQCSQAYNGTTLGHSVKVQTDAATNSSMGIQVWTVPETQHYTIIAKGASGGRGAESSQMTSRGSIVKVVLYLRRGETLNILVGQEGASVCDQNVALPEKIQIACGSITVTNNSSSSTSAGSSRSLKGRNAFVDLIQMNNLLGGGGGGGGGTFVWKMKGNTPVPLVIAGGGGGLAYNSSAKILPYGRGFNSTLEPQSGSTQPNGAGGGGGWSGPIVRFDLEGLTAMSKRFGTQKDRFKDTGDENATVWISAGESVLDAGGFGGVPCIDSIKWGAQGGFGGGGGGCTAGGGGGGYVGGNAHVGLSANGEGGLSYVTKGGLHPSLEAGGHDGPGGVIIIPSLERVCGCEYHCVLLDDFNIHTACVCAENNILTEDGSTCVSREASFPKDYLVGLIICCLLLLCFLSMLCIYIYNRYQKQKAAHFRRKMLGGPELQLSRIRAQAGPNGVLTEYNPNYEFSSVSSRDLKKIPRENLQLVRSIGQGAFGEVYQGFYKQRANDSVEMPVAVKTLPLLASQQAEEDFLMEAMIMSKFNHANIVHFIGVCDDKHPRFIVLELLAGGDLKTFLRESRPKPDKPSPLTMKDLLMCAMDVAKGCQYLEENHFIHRDIAARNCLLTTKGPGRVVKIADFGMARDIYRADYYKKGGKAMMPVKWMPPEAFLDGIFTSKTDVWSFGVLLWEVFSMGYMPYPGRGNQDVMHLVTHGGRLEPPQNCPAPVYGIMNQCWHPIPEERPKFATLLERLGYCIQDPEVVNAPLPVFQRPPSSERDATLMRPNPDESSCLCITQGPRSSHNMSMFSGHMAARNSPTADYLIPLSPHSSTSSPARLVYPSIDICVPESASSETLLDDDDQEQRGNGVQHSTANVTESSGNPSKGPLKNVTTGGRSPQSVQNGMDPELALNPALLDEVKRPGPYINVGMSRSDNRPTEGEIHC